MDFPKFNRSVIDIHSHFNHGVSGNSIDNNFQDLSISSLDFMFKDNARFGIKEVGYSTYASVLSDKYVIEENEYLHNLIETNDNIYQWVVIHPLIPETFEQAKRMLSHKKVLGIKIHPSMHKYDITEQADKIFSFANQMKACVLMHPAKIGLMPEFLKNYPNMTLIVAHIGSLEHINAVKNAAHRNIYVDTSGYLSSLNNIIEYAVNQIGSDRILFGTDTYSPAFQLSRIAFANISLEDKENILYKNALRLFPKSFQ